MQSQDKPLDSGGGSKSPASIAPTPSPTSRVFAGFFRRRRKSTSSNHDDSSDIDYMDNQDALRAKASPTDGSKEKDVYGNYATVSGTGANLMRDLFNRKYRASARLSGNFSSSNDAEARRKSNQSGSNASSLASLFKFRSKRDTIKEERSPSPEGEEKGKRDHSAPRSRHISTGSDAKKYVTTSSTKTGGIMSSNKVKGFFDSFRQRAPRETTPEGAGPASPSSQTVPQSSLGPAIVYAPGSKKKKKFKVTRAMEDDPSQFGPNNFLEMYRKNRAESEMKRLNRMHHLSASPTFSKASTIHSYEPLHLVIWRDKKKGTRVFKLPKRYTDSLEFEEYHGEMVDSEELSVTRFAKVHPCYDLMASSSKLVIFDINLNVKKAFYALVNNTIRSAPLWSLDRHDFAGLLTVTDFLRVLQKYYHSPNLQMKDLEDQKISNWKELLGDSGKSTIQVEPDTSLLAAAAILSRHNVHHVPVVEPQSGNILFVLTSKKLLRFIASYMRTLTREPGKEVAGNVFLQQTVEEADIGTFDNLAVATPDMTLIRAIDIFIEKNVSALPVVNESNQVVDVYSKSDIFSIADDQMYSNLNTTIKEAISRRAEGSHYLQTCQASERVCDVICKIVDAGVHCAIVVSDRKELKGIISITDIIDFLVLKPFYKYRNQLAEKLKRSSVDLKRDSGEQESTLPTLQEHSPTDHQRHARGLEPCRRLTPENKHRSQVRFELESNPSKEELERVGEGEPEAAESADGKSGRAVEGVGPSPDGGGPSKVEIQNNVVCVGT